MILTPGTTFKTSDSEVVYVIKKATDKRININTVENPRKLVSFVSVEKANENVKSGWWIIIN